MGIKLKEKQSTDDPCKTLGISMLYVPQTSLESAQTVTMFVPILNCQALQRSSQLVSPAIQKCCCKVIWPCLHNTLYFSSVNKDPTTFSLFINSKPKMVSTKIVNKWNQECNFTASQSRNYNKHEIVQIQIWLWLSIYILINPYK